MDRGVMGEKMELIVGRVFYPIEVTHVNPAGDKTQGGTVLIDELQRHINKLMGVSDETYLKHICKTGTPEKGHSNDIQAIVNEMMGVDEETFKKYNK